MKNIIVYNPRHGSNVEEFAWNDSKWEPLGVNQMRAYPQDVAEEMIRRYGFLQKVAPENVAKLKEDMEKEVIACEYCDYQTTSDKKMKGHMLGKHKLSKETEEAIKGVPAAKGEAVKTKTQEKDVKSAEEIEGIPNTKDGPVGDWYGPGLEDDVPSGGMGVRRVGSAGNFGA